MELSRRKEVLRLLRQQQRARDPDVRRLHHQEANENYAIEQEPHTTDVGWGWLRDTCGSKNAPESRAVAARRRAHPSQRRASRIRPSGPTLEAVLWSLSGGLPVSTGTPFSTLASSRTGWIRRRCARLARQGQADASDTQRLEGQPPARRNAQSDGQRTTHSGGAPRPRRDGGGLSHRRFVTSLDRYYPSTRPRVHASTYGLVRPVQSSCKLCTKLYTVAGIAL